MPLVGVRGTGISNYDAVHNAQLLAASRPRILPIEPPTPDPIISTQPVGPPERHITPPEHGPDTSPWIPSVPPPEDTPPAPIPKTKTGLTSVATPPIIEYVGPGEFYNPDAPVGPRDPAKEIADAIAAGIARAGGGTTPPTSGPPATNGGAAAGPAADTALITSLLGLVSNMYAGAGTSGGGTGFDGTVSAPISSTAGTEPVDQSTAPKSKNPLIVLLFVGVIVGGIWYWLKHRGKKK